jgi:para-aminobenzoate synthetase component 1
VHDFNEFKHAYIGKYKSGWIIAVSNADTDTAKKSDNQWAFGHITYDYKNEIEALKSEQQSPFQFPNLSFFQPEVVAILQSKNIQILHCSNTATEQNLISALSKPVVEKSDSTKSNKIIDLTTKQEYLQNVRKLLNHIQQGDIYEINYCIGFRHDGEINPYETFRKLYELTEAPYSCFYKRDHLYVLCASPERYIQKTGTTLISQPIKGTAARSNDKDIDERRKSALKNDPKERAENVMIVDIVRNDLSRIAQRGTVRVPELCQVYSYKTVHQMISTIACELKPDVTFRDIIHATFPMGSMTGAPKIRAMQLADQYENIRRGIYSGTIGYIDPEGNFDFNVVIRSIVYDSKNQIAELYAGSAITANCDPEKEYEECLLKAQSMIRALN